MNTKLNSRTFIAGLVFLAAIAFSATPAQAGHRSYSQPRNHHGFSISYCGSNVYGTFGNYQSYPRIIPGIRVGMHHLSADIIHIITAIISVVVTFPEVIIAVITHEHGTGGGIIADITETQDISSAQSMREAFMGFPHFIFSRR